ncbi:MAG TPA: FAD-binding oxidoreductase [Isosphaeraceae bacterium]|nr:FAD-binding oxidoreductase [Isosphaeraceae bacterium]
MNWPESPTEFPLGDGRYASLLDRPGSVEELAEVVRTRTGEGHALYPQGGRSALEFGGVPERPGVVVDTTGLDRVLDYPASDMTITVEAGLTLARLQAILSEANQRLPLDAPGAEKATLGGIFATNACGPRRFGSGRPRDLVLGASFAKADGAVVKGGGRVVKNVAGYDLPKLLTGSLGSLGIITQMTLKTRPRPELSALGWVRFETAAEVAKALDRLNSSKTRPMAVELLNRPAAEALGSGFDLPPGERVVVVGLEDNAESVRWQIGALGEEVGADRLSVLEGEASGPLWAALADSQDQALGGLTLLANLRPSAVVGFSESLSADRWSVQAHAGNGIVRAHLRKMDADLDGVEAEVKRLRRQAVEGGGNLTLPQCPTEWKARLGVWGEPRADWEMMKRIKETLDPERVMNPGRFVGNL